MTMPSTLDLQSILLTTNFNLTTLKPKQLMQMDISTIKLECATSLVPIKDVTLPKDIYALLLLHILKIDSFNSFDNINFHTT